MLTAVYLDDARNGFHFICRIERETLKLRLTQGERAPQDLLSIFHDLLPIMSNQRTDTQDTVTTRTIVPLVESLQQLLRNICEAHGMSEPEVCATVIFENGQYRCTFDQKHSEDSWQFYPPPEWRHRHQLVREVLAPLVDSLEMTTEGAFALRLTLKTGDTTSQLFALVEKLEDMMFAS